MLPHPDPIAAPRPLHLRPIPRGDAFLDLSAPSAASLAAEAEAWRDLLARALEPNLFAGPDVMLPALQHLDAGRGVTLAAVREGPRLLGLFPLVTSRVLPFAAARLWRPPLAPLGTPLVAADRAEAVIRALLDWLAGHARRPGVLDLDGLQPDGSLAAAFARVAEATGRRLSTSPAPAPVSPPVVASAAPAAVVQGGTPREVRDGVEHFLILEAASAGRRGVPALIQAPGRANYVRTATRHLARRGLCRVSLDRVGGEVAAATVLVGAGAAARPWLAATGDDAAAPADARTLPAKGDGAMLCDLRIAVRAGNTPRRAAGYAGRGAWAPVNGNDPLAPQGPPR